MIYEFLDYRDYLKSWLKAQPKRGHGIRRQMAEALNCQSTFISQTLHKQTNLTLEHGHKLTQFLQHDSKETQFFLLQIQFQRAGTQELKNYFKSQIELQQQERFSIQKRLEIKNSLSIEDQTRYYSSWHYSAVRVILSIPEYRKKQKIAEKLALPLETVHQVLDFLCRTGLVEQDGDSYKVGKKDMHLGNDSALITKHHSNWRVRALSSLDQEKTEDLHYSLAISIGKKEQLELKQMTIDYIESIFELLKKSKPETICSLGIDFYEL